jgi:cytochrome c-type biogenesis protein CcmH/NrfG
MYRCSPGPATRRTCAVLLALTLAAGCSRGCSRSPAVDDEAYRDAVAAFHVSLAAMQTSQDVLARGELERLIQLAPEEPAGWANLGLLLLRQQQIDEGIQRITRAAELAPRHAAIQRMLAQAEAQTGDTEASIRHWRRAMELDPADMKAPFALALELERQGGPGDEAEAQRILGSLADRSGNLAARLEYARLSAKRGDSPALLTALDALAEASAAWPPDAQARLAAAREASASGPANATTPVVFLRNVLIRSPEYRAARAAVAIPETEMGEPLAQFVALANPDPRPAPADDRLTFSIVDDAVPSVASGAITWAGAVWLTGDSAPIVAAASARELRLATGTALPFPGGASASAPGPFGVAEADLNYDMRSDLVFAGEGGLTIFQQDAQGGFTDVTRAAKIPVDLGPLHGVWAADLDTDGDLDLVVARRDGPPVVLRNNGDGTVLAQSPFEGASRVRGFVWADIDGEGVPDAILLEETGTVRTFLNLRGGEFRERMVPDSFAGIVAIAAAEVTGDAVMDVVGVTRAGAFLRLSQAADGRTWDTAEIARATLPPDFFAHTGRLVVADVDNNGAADLIVSNESSARVLLGGPDGAFHQLDAPLAMSVLAAADLDGNGRLDLVGTAEGGGRVARSRGEKAYHWQAIRPRAATVTGDQRINSFGIGGEVEVRTGLHGQKQAIASPSVHFGLGEATRTDVARIIWPNGVLQSEFALAADVAIPASQRLKGSCPWLFAWNGREMAFVTDFIWRSPLGLRINAQETADVLMTEEWVKLRGDQLAPKDGVYDVRVTADLWETHFFDHLSLLVVDHPEDTEVFVDERFAVPPPALTVHVMSTVREFAAVRDDEGRDVREIVRARDDRHLDFAGRGVYQGVTRPHYVEIELPADAPRSGPLWLVGQGWIHPTDSSVNVALSQGAHPAPSGLSLHVADASGRFKEVRSGLGFPAGKDKTVLIDLTGVFPASGTSTGPRTLRLHTNLEIFWDRLGWAVGRPDITLEPKRIELKSAELRYRGFSVTGQKDASTPERPRYIIEGTAPRWRDLEGFHTRFGDVRELLLQVDDRYVIMNAGDEMVLTFPEAPPPAAGMKRDFVIIGDGWEKDGDYNTTASRTVLPLPTHLSGRYEQGTGRLEDDPVYQRHRADFERYHTRYVSPEGVREALRRR